VLASEDDGLADLWRTFSLPVIRDYLLLAYRATVTDQEARRLRGLDVAENARPHIASPELIVDESGKRLLMFFHGYGSGGYQHSRLARSPDGNVFLYYVGAGEQAIGVARLTMP